MEISKQEYNSIVQSINACNEAIRALIGLQIGRDEYDLDELLRLERDIAVACNCLTEKE